MSVSVVVTIQLGMRATKTTCPECMKNSEWNEIDLKPPYLCRVCGYSMRERRCINYPKNIVTPLGQKVLTNQVSSGDKIVMYERFLSRFEQMKADGIMQETSTMYYKLKKSFQRRHVYLDQQSCLEVLFFAVFPNLPNQSYDEV